MEFNEMLFRMWGCCAISSICISIAIGLVFTLIIDSRLKKKKARLVEEDEPEDVQGHTIGKSN